MTNGRQLPGSGMTPLQIEFCHLYAFGPNAGNGAACIGEAGYKAGTKEAAAAMASELLTRDDIRTYLALLYAERRAGRVIQSRPWEKMLPAAQALQMEVIEVARDAVASLRAAKPQTQPKPTPEALLGPAGFTGSPPNPDGVPEEQEERAEAERPGLDPNKVNGPLVNLIKAGLEAAELVESYAIGRPVTRTEQGAPGDFKDQGLKETVAEIRESLQLMEAANVLGLVLPSQVVEVQAIAAAPKVKVKRKRNKKGKE